MSKLLRALTLINEGKEQSLICEVPKELINSLELDEHGNANLGTLLDICKHLADGKQSKEKTCKKFEKNRKIMRLIYDESIAIDKK